MNKKIIIKILLFIIISSLVFCYTYYFTPLYGDEIWNYGSGYNIFRGMIPYRDFNLVVTPLYAFLVSLFILIFNHHLFCIHFFNSIIITFIIFMLYNKSNVKSFIIIPFILLCYTPSYNLLCLFFLFLLFYVYDNCNSNKKDILVAFIVSLIFLTKQSVGLCLFIPMIYYSKNRFKCLYVFLIPIIILFIYLIFNDAFFQFIDYCFLGLFDFGDSNSVLLFLPLEIIVVLVLVICFIKTGIKDYFYLLMFQVITIPILDDYHFMLGLIPCIVYFFSNIKLDNYKIKYYIFMSIFLCFFWNYSLHGYQKLHFYSDRDSYLYGRNIPSYVEDSINNIGSYINGNKYNYDYIYYFSANAYWVKMNINYQLTKYDMICNGNMGYMGSIKYIDEIDNYCTSHKCMFILYKYEFRAGNVSQTNRNLINYVKNNYNNKEVYDVFNIYSN